MTGRPKPGWSKTGMIPVWWPGDIPFRDVNNRPKPKLDQLVAIMSSFRDWKQRQDTEEVEDSVMDTEDSASPMVPLSVPLSTSTPSSCPAHITDLEVADPEMTVSLSLEERIASQFGPASIFNGESWQPIRVLCDFDELRQSTLLEIMDLLNEDAECWTTISTESARHILKALHLLPWGAQLLLADKILGHMPKQGSPRFLNKYQKRLPERFYTFVPPQVHEMGLEPFDVAADGNCFYNSVAILMTGDETDAVIYRLGAALYGFVHFEDIVEEVSARYGSREEAILWAAALSSSEPQDDNSSCVDVRSVVLQTVKRHLLEALINFRDVGFFQICLAAGFLQRPIQQHCKREGAEMYNTLEHPPRCSQEPGAVPLEPLHIVWLPLKGEGDRYNHICPLLPWKCGAVDMDCCVFGWGMHAQHKSRNEMAQCLSCSEWYHCACLGITFQDAVNNTIADCGCLPSTGNSDKREISWYENRQSVSGFLSK